MCDVVRQQPDGEDENEEEEDELDPRVEVVYKIVLALLFVF